MRVDGGDELLEGLEPDPLLGTEPLVELGTLELVTKFEPVELAAVEFGTDVLAALGWTDVTGVEVGVAKLTGLPLVAPLLPLPAVDELPEVVVGVDGSLVFDASEEPAGEPVDEEPRLPVPEAGLELLEPDGELEVGTVLSEVGVAFADVPLKPVAPE